MYILIKGFKGCNSASVQVDGHILAYVSFA